MNIITPTNIDLSSSNVSESAYSDYASGTTYAAGDKVYVRYESDGTTERTPHEIYESVISQSGNYPPDDDGTNWVLVSATNRWKMFDAYVSSQTENATTIEVTLAANLVDTLCLFGLSGQSVDVKVTVGGEDKLDESYSLEEDVDGWSNYYFTDPGDYYKSDIKISLPGPYLSSTVEVTINSSGTAKCGHLILGKEVFLGKTQYSPKVSIVDYSSKTTNSFGETYLNQRAFAKTVNAQLFLETGGFSIIDRRLASVRSTPIVWDFNNEGVNHEALLIYGFYKDFDLTLESLSHSICTLEIEGLI